MVEEIARKERELEALEDEILLCRSSRPSWPLWVFAVSLALFLLALRW